MVYLYTLNTRVELPAVLIQLYHNGGDQARRLLPALSSVLLVSRRSVEMIQMIDHLTCLSCRTVVETHSNRFVQSSSSVPRVWTAGRASE